MKKTINEDEIDWKVVDRKCYEVLKERVAEYRDATQFCMTKVRSIGFC